MQDNINNQQNSTSIIVCIDTSNASEKALRYGCIQAKKYQHHLEILAVIEASHKNLLFGAQAISAQKRQQMEKHIKKLMNSICSEYEINPVFSIREGDIASEITHQLKFANNCQMVIFGKSNNSLSDNTVLPKIINRIGNKIKVPVIIIPENFENLS
ncbi:MAG: universal stress protein [Alphaproteobacteria bacterium]